MAAVLLRNNDFRVSFRWSRCTYLYIAVYLVLPVCNVFVVIVIINTSNARIIIILYKHVWAYTQCVCLYDTVGSVCRWKGAGVVGGSENKTGSVAVCATMTTRWPSRPETSVKADRYARAELFVDAVIVGISRAPKEKKHAPNEEEYILYIYVYAYIVITLYV